MGRRRMEETKDTRDSMDDGRRRAKCPVCSKDVQDPFRPFCSERCCLVDLGRWFGESYRIETDEPFDSPPAGLDESADKGDGGGRVLH